MRFLHLRACHVADAINAEFGTDHDQNWVSQTVESIKERHLSDFDKSYEPPLYNVWKQQKKGSSSQHFGGFPKRL